MQGAGSWIVKGVGFLRLNKNVGAEVDVGEEGAQGAAVSTAGAKGVSGVRVVMRKIGNMELILNSRLFAGMACKKGCVRALLCVCVCVVHRCLSTDTGWLFCLPSWLAGADIWGNVFTLCVRTHVFATAFLQRGEGSDILWDARSRAGDFPCAYLDPCRSQFPVRAPTQQLPQGLSKIKSLKYRMSATRACVRVRASAFLGVLM